MSIELRGKGLNGRYRHARMPNGDLVSATETM